MGPGTTWEPFRITEGEYNELVTAIQTLDPQSLGEEIRFGEVKFEFDTEFDSETSWEKWMHKVCARHRKAWQKKMRG